MLRTALLIGTLILAGTPALADVQFERRSRPPPAFGQHMPTWQHAPSWRTVPGLPSFGARRHFKVVPHPRLDLGPGVTIIIRPWDRQWSGRRLDGRLDEHFAFGRRDRFILLDEFGRFRGRVIVPSRPDGRHWDRRWGDRR